MLHIMRWSRPDIYNSIRDLSSHMNGVTKDHSKAMHHIIKYVLSTPTRRCKLKPEIKVVGKELRFLVFNQGNR